MEAPETAVRPGAAGVTPAEPGAVRVTAPARLHLGLLGAPPGRAGRIGSLGLTLERPRVVLEVYQSGALLVEGPQAERARALAALFMERAEIRSGARLVVREAIPEHVGLGSGTQLALAVAAALSRLHGLPGDVAAWCAALGRGRRSGIGAHAFRLGGFLLDAGRSDGAPPPPPLVFRQPFPEEWGILAVVPDEGRGVSGEDEERAFEALPPPPEALLERLGGVILTRLIPSLLERDLRSFGAALERVQEGVGRCFAEVQGGLYHPLAAPVVRWLRAAGARGVGQSSWGPCAYAIVPDEAAAGTLAARLRAEGPLGPGARVLLLRPRNRGAEIARLGP